MQLLDKHIVEFQILYQKHFGKEINKGQALEKGLQLIHLVKIVSRCEPQIKITNQLHKQT